MDFTCNTDVYLDNKKLNKAVRPNAEFMLTWPIEAQVHSLNDSGKKKGIKRNQTSNMNSFTVTV